MNQPQMYESAWISVFFLPTWLPIDVVLRMKGHEDDEDSWFCCLHFKFPLCNACSLSEENDETPSWKAGKFVAYCVPCSKLAELALKTIFFGNLISF